jgi:hypothetical protein
MPLHGTRNQLDASYFFDIGSVNKRKNIIIPENILELEKLIKKKKGSLKFLELLFCEEYVDSIVNRFDKHILEKIALYKNPCNEKLLLEESDYYVVYLGGYYIETAEGNHRNWIYANEIDIECVELHKYIILLEEELKQKIINVGVKIALLRI